MARVTWTGLAREGVDLMNSFKRINAAVNFQKPDRVPVIAQVFGHAGVVSGVSLGEYVQDGRLLAECQLKALKRYGYDAVFALMDVCVETEALGSSLAYRSHQYPAVTFHAFSKHTNLDSLSIPDPREAGRMPGLLEAARILRTELGDDVLVVGCILGPMTLATQLVGIKEALYMAIDDSEGFTRLLNFCADVVIRFGVAQIESGAHLPIVFEPSGSPAVVPFQFFREFILPCLTRVFHHLKLAGGRANWLHIAGPAGSILPFYHGAGVDIANFDFCVDPGGAQDALPRTCLDGNIKPLDFVAESSETIARESTRLMDLFADRGGFILSSGCEIPPEAKPENITAMVSAAGKAR